MLTPAAIFTYPSTSSHMGHMPNIYTMTEFSVVVLYFTFLFYFTHIHRNLYRFDLSVPNRIIQSNCAKSCQTW